MSTVSEGTSGGPTGRRSDPTADLPIDSVDWVAALAEFDAWVNSPPDPDDVTAFTDFPPAEAPVRSTSADLLGVVLASRPGPDTLGLLTTVDPNELDPAGQVDWVRAWDRHASYTAAQRLAAIVTVADHTPPANGGWLSGYEIAEAELAPALHQSRRTISHDLSLAADLAGKLAPTAAALAAGEISLAHARALADELATASPPVAAAVQADVLPRATAGLTPRRLRHRTRRVLHAVDAAAAADRATTARADRSVRVHPLPDDMAELVWTSTAAEITLAKQTLDRLATRPTSPDGDATVDQRRSDALHTLIQGAWNDPDLPELPGRRARKADITVPYDTLVGLADHPGELTGYGPITAELARRITTDAHLRFLIYNPASGALLTYDPGTWRPSAALQRHTDAKAPHCTAPGCDTRTTDHDHVIPFHTGGPTEPGNQQPECEHDHLLKTHAGWTVTTTPDGGSLWTTRTGKQYYEPPHDYRPDG